MEYVKCIDKYKNGDIIIYRLQNYCGNIRDVNESQLIKVIKSGLLSVVNMTFNESDSSFNIAKESEEKTFKYKFESYKKYEEKQRLIGRVFDFEITNSKIYINRYHDAPERTEIIIPDFVDGFKTKRKGSYASERVFGDCKYIQKIIMKKPILGETKNLFECFKGRKLDLTEFNTSNITNMTCMFRNSNIDKIILGGLFNTSKVKSMSNMFDGCVTTKLILGDSFYTTSLKSAAYMFEFCEAEEIDLGDKFDASNISVMKFMFYGAEVDNIKLGKRFDTSNVTDFVRMFSDCDVLNIDLGDKFNTSKAIKIFQMFHSCGALNIRLGSKFILKPGLNVTDMFFNCNSNIYIDKNTDKYTLDTINKKMKKQPILY